LECDAARGFGRRQHCRKDRWHQEAPQDQIHSQAPIDVQAAIFDSNDHTGRNDMRLGFSALITGTVLAVSSLAHANPPAKSAAIQPTPSPVQSTTGPIKTSGHSTAPSNPAAPITVDGLAQVTGILNYCSQVDRPNTGTYTRALANILSGHASSEMKIDQSSAGFGAGVRSINLQLASLPISTVASGCKNFLAGK
jgi:hypothetical protein